MNLVGGGQALTTVVQGIGVNQCHSEIRRDRSIRKKTGYESHGPIHPDHLYPASGNGLSYHCHQIPAGLTIFGTADALGYRSMKQCLRRLRTIAIGIANGIQLCFQFINLP